jgi:hypothetical protein
MSSEHSSQFPVDDTDKPSTLFVADDLTAEPRVEAMSIQTRRRLSSCSPTLESIPEEDGEFEEIPLEPEHLPVSDSNTVANFDITYSNSIVQKIILEENVSHYEEDEYQLRAYPNGHPIDHAYTNFCSRLTIQEQEKLDEWILAISSGTSDASLDMS